MCGAAEHGRSHGNRLWYGEWVCFRHRNDQLYGWGCPAITVVTVNSLPGAIAGAVQVWRRRCHNTHRPAWRRRMEYQQHSYCQCGRSYRHSYRHSARYGGDHLFIRGRLYGNCNSNGEPVAAAHHRYPCYMRRLQHHTGRCRGQRRMEQ